MERISQSSSPSFVIRRVKSHVRIHSQRIQAKPGFDLVANKFDDSEDWVKPAWAEELGRRIMVVVDSRFEAKVALQWALSHSVQKQDTIVLVHIKKPSNHGKEISPRVYDLLYTMKSLCESKIPEVQVEIVIVEGKEKGPSIVEEVRKQGVSLLVLGQRKRSLMWRVIIKWSRNRIGNGVVEYCIQNANCMAIAVRRKSRKLGGYLITTRQHKDFWQLA